MLTKNIQQRSLSGFTTSGFYYLFTVSFNGHRPAQQGSARTELIGPREVPSPTPKTRPDQHTGNSIPYALSITIMFSITIVVAIET